MAFVYIIGLPQMGGCWIPNEKCFSSFEDAEKVLKEKYWRGEKGAEKIFTLYETNAAKEIIK
jgi:hypothetical protein